MDALARSSRRLWIVLPDAGTYPIEVYADGTAAGAFAFPLQPVT